MSRRAIAFLGMQQVARMLALPEGLRAVAVRDDFQRDGVAVLVEGDALDDQPDGCELPRLPVPVLDRAELAMRAEVVGFCVDYGRNVTVCCPVLPCSWSREWERETVTLAKLADVVQQHLEEVHAGS